MSNKIIYYIYIMNISRIDAIESTFFPETLNCYGTKYPARIEERDGCDVLVIDVSHEPIRPNTPQNVQIDNSARWHINKILEGTYDRSMFELEVKRRDIQVPKESKFDTTVYKAIEFEYTLKAKPVSSDELFPAGC